jgi:hypothetical protein
MVNRSNAAVAGPIPGVADMDLHLMTRRKVNLLLIGPEGVIQDTLYSLGPELAKPVRTWTAPDPLELPHPSQPGTLILRNVAALSPIDQSRLCNWMEQSAGRIRVVGTTNGPLMAKVDSGAFLDHLYYRLNVGMVDMMADHI